MRITLEKVKRLEQYLNVEHAIADPVLDMTLTKLLQREVDRIIALKTRLVRQIAEFEQRYSLSSAKFYPQYEQGKMGDDTDFIEWAATIEMLNHIETQLNTLETASLYESGN
jgi:hypothetical protein